MLDTVTLSIVIAVVVIVLLAIYLSVRVVQQYERMVIFRLGRTDPTLVRDPGLRFLIPIIDKPTKVDIREKFIEIPSQTTITKDNAPINIDFLIYWYIVDPLRSLVNVQNFSGALQGIATTTLRAVIGDIMLDDVLSKRDQINEVLRAKLDEVREDEPEPPPEPEPEVEPGAEPATESEPAPVGEAADPEERRRSVHEHGRAALDEMRSGDGDESS